MKKALIISMHSLPLNVIASYRANAFLTHFHKYGISPTLVTHLWEKEINGLEWGASEQPYIEDQLDCGKVIRLSRPDVKPSAPLSRWKLFSSWCTGFLDDKVESRSEYNVYRNFLNNYLMSEDYDLIIAIFSPYYHIRLAYELNRKFRIPYIVDYRDTHNNRLLSNDSPYKSFGHRIKTKIAEFYLKKWNANSLFVTSTSQKWASFMSSFGDVEGHEILNGFESEFLNEVDAEPDENQFNITSVGNLQDDQDLRCFFEAILAFNKNNSNHKAKINFVGITSGYRKNAWEEIMNNVPSEMLNLSGRVPKNEAILTLKKSHVLVFPLVLGERDYYTGKIFEYLGVKRNILSFPKWDSVGSRLIEDTNSGVNLNSSQEIEKYIQKKYEDWLKGEYNYDGEERKIKKYDRAYSVKKMSELILKYLTVR